MAVEFRQYKNIAEHFNCPIHLGKLKDPRRLPCEHTFCADCLNGCIHTAFNTRNDGMFECPVCRTKNHIPTNSNNDWARGFPIDAFCVIQLHTLSQYEQSIVCEKHIQKFKEYFCFHHRELVCSDCVIEGHTRSPCSCGSIQDSILEVRLQIKELIAKLRLQEERAQRIMDSKIATSHSNDLLKKISEVEKTLSKFYKSMKAKLKESKQKVVEATKISQYDRDHLTTVQGLISKTKTHVENVIRPEKSKRSEAVNEILSIWTPLEIEARNFDTALDEIETRPFCVSIKADEKFLNFISFDKSPLIVTTETTNLPSTPTKEKSMRRMNEQAPVVEVEVDSPRRIGTDSPEVTTIPSPTMVQRTITLSSPVRSKQPTVYSLKRPSSHEGKTPRKPLQRQQSPSRYFQISKSFNNTVVSQSSILPKVGTGELITKDTSQSYKDNAAQLHDIEEVSNFELPCGDIIMMNNQLITLTETSIQRFTLDYKYIESINIRFPWRLCAIKGTVNVAVNHNTRFISIVATEPNLAILYRIETEKPYSQICHMRSQVLEDRFGRSKYHEHFALSHTTDLRADCIDVLKISYDLNPFSNFTAKHAAKLVPLRTKTLIRSDKHSVVRSPNSLAPTCDGKRLIIGAEAAVVCVRKSGEIVWTHPVVRFVSSICCEKGLVFVCIENEQKLMILDEAGNKLCENIFPLGCNIVRPNRVSVEEDQMIVREFSEKDWKSTVHVFNLYYV
ncbi:Intraflagellar transport protein 80 [Mactra antiquata]